jgi:hypothetical protein
MDMFLFGLALLCLAPASPKASGPVQSALTIRVLPDPVYAERVGGLLRLSCDFELSNSSDKALEINFIWAKAFSADGTLLAWNKVDSNGARPSIEVLGRHRIEAKGQLTVFNPFLFDSPALVHHLTYEFRLRGPADEDLHVIAELRPVAFRQKTQLIVPVPGARLWVYDGPGFLSHHRRVDLLDPFNRDVLGLRGNAERYALDLVVLDKDGEAFHGNPMEQKNWVGLGALIVAPAAGTVIEAEGSLPDDIPFDESRAKENPMLMVGNHIVIDHGNGEFSALAHFRQGSLRVRKGRRVVQGQVLGEMGHSGMGSGLIHLHYELRNRPGFSDAEGLPATFAGVRRAGSARQAPAEIEAGWVIETQRLPR